MFLLLVTQWGMTLLRFMSVARRNSPLTMLSSMSNTQPSTSPGLHDLTALDDETIEFLLNTSHEIECSLEVG